VHELSVAHALVTAVLSAVADTAEPVAEVHVQVGALCGVVPAALEFAYDVACAGTPLAGSRLVVEHRPAVVHCAACDADAVVPGALVLVCPTCGTATGDVRAGRELDVTHVVLHDAPVGVGA